MTSFTLNYHLSTNSGTLGVKVSTYECWEGHNSLHNNHEIYLYRHAVFYKYEFVRSRTAMQIGLTKESYR